MTEVWADVVGYAGYYQVSLDGKVRSLARTVVRSGGRPLRVSERILRAFSTRGADRVSLSRDGIITHRKVYELVAEAFGKETT